jgi:hypothetical protein
MYPPLRKIKAQTIVKRQNLPFLLKTRSIKVQNESFFMKNHVMRLDSNFKKKKNFFFHVPSP